MTKRQDFHMRPIRGRYQGIPGVFFATSDIQVSSTLYFFLSRRHLTTHFVTIELKVKNKEKMSKNCGKIRKNKEVTWDDGGTEPS